MSIYAYLAWLVGASPTDPHSRCGSAPIIRWGTKSVSLLTAILSCLSTSKLRLVTLVGTGKWNKSLQRGLVIVLVLTGEDLLGVHGGHGYSRSAREPQPVGDRCGRTPRNVI